MSIHRLINRLFGKSRIFQLSLLAQAMYDQPLWGQLKIKVIAIVVALVLLVVGLVAAWFILNGDNHGGGSDNQDWPNKTDIDNVPFGNSTTQNSTSKNSAAQSDIVYIRVL